MNEGPISVNARYCPFPPRFASQVKQKHLLPISHGGHLGVLFAIYLWVTCCLQYSYCSRLSALNQELKENLIYVNLIYIKLDFNNGSLLWITWSVLCSL